MEAKNKYDEISLRQNFLTEKNSYGKITRGEKSYVKKFLCAVPNILFVYRFCCCNNILKNEKQTHWDVQNKTSRIFFEVTNLYNNQMYTKCANVLRWLGVILG